MKAIVRNIPHIVCPYCGEGTSTIAHLEIGRHFGPWYCDDCGKSYSGVRTADGADIELLPQWSREVECLLEYIHDPRLKLVVPGLEISNDDGSESTYYRQEGGHAYFYDEHSCPSNLLRNGDSIGAEVWFEDPTADGVIDKDPHGIFRFVKIIEEKDASNGKSQAN